MIANSTPLFALGELVATPGAIEALEKAKQSPADFISRHVSGDWGEVDQEDCAANEQALHDGSRIFSAYRTQLDEKLWVITEADRSSTCILLPDEY